MPGKKNDQWTIDTLTGDVLPAENRVFGKGHRVVSMARRLFVDPVISKTFIVLVSGSIYAFLIAADMGLFRAIEAWERNSGLSVYPVGEFVTLLIVLGVAIATFVYHRYEEIRDVSLDETMPVREASPSEIWANFQYEQLETLFRQVETAKREWQLSLDSIRDMVILTGPDGTIQRCNRAFRNFIGLSYEEILQENIASLLAKFGIEMNGLNLKELNARFHISGKWFGVRSYPYTEFETGNVTGVVIIMLDVSTKNVAEEKVRFVWGNKTYSRLDGGKVSSSHPDSDADTGEPPTVPPEAPGKAAN